MNAPVPGQIGVVTDGTGPLPRAIRFVTRSPADHAVVVMPAGMCASADRSGVNLRPLTDFPHAYYSAFTMSAAEADAIVAWTAARIHRPYSYMDDALVGIEYVFGFRWPAPVRAFMNRDKEYMCSQLAAMALATQGICPVPGKTAGETSPADLYDYFTVRGWV